MQCAHVVRLRVIEGRDQSVVFGNVVGGSTDVLFEARNDLAARIANHHAVRRGAGIPTRSTVNVRAPRRRRSSPRFRLVLAEKSSSVMGWSFADHHEAD